MEENSSELLCVLLQTAKWEPACYQMYQQWQNSTQAYCLPVVLRARPHTAPFYGKTCKFSMLIAALFTDLSISAGSQPWVPTSTSRSYGGKSSRTWCGSSSACAAGSTASSLPCTALPGRPGQTRLAGWDIRPSKVMRWSYHVPVSLLPSLTDSRTSKSEAGTPPEVSWMKYCYKRIKSIAVPTSQTLFHVFLSSCPLWSIRQMKIKWILTSVLALALCYCCNVDQCF